MKKRVFIILAAVVLLIVAALLIKSFSASKHAPTITLPTPAGQTRPSDISSESYITITPETVCTVLSDTLTRTEAFSRTYTVTTYWQGGESAEELSLRQNGDKLLMSLEHGGSVKNLLILGSDLYIWYDGAMGVSNLSYHKNFEPAEADRFARLLTYEELYSVDTSAISDAGFVELSGEPCIYAEYRGYNNYVNRIYVSVTSGLLVSAEIYDGESLIYSMRSGTTELSPPPDEVFTPPAR